MLAQQLTRRRSLLLRQQRPRQRRIAAIGDGVGGVSVLHTLLINFCCLSVVASGQMYPRRRDPVHRADARRTIRRLQIAQIMGHM